MESNGHMIAEILSSDCSDAETSEQLLPLLYDELRRLARRQLARERPGLTLQPTALVHEAYLRLIENPDLRWDSRRKFFAAAARSMRQILVNRAIQKKTERHGGKLSRRPFNEEICIEEPAPDELLAIDEALKKLDQIDPRKAEIVLLRYFAGLTIEETSESLCLSPATVKRDWQFAKAWLLREISSHDDE